MNKRGRPKKEDSLTDNKQKIVDTAIALIRKHGASAVTMRSVCEAAGLSIGTFYHYFANKDNLLMYFVREASFDSFALKTPFEDLAGRITELYMLLVGRYRSLGADFMKQFYTTDNRALSAYMGASPDKFPDGTVMARCEAELSAARQAGILAEEIDAHQASADVCTIVKGCVFEWCLGGGQIEIEPILRRILARYFDGIVRKQAGK
ncbi:MAG: TetR/AcrR family transcriptional regulator [Oscillospiraceae bacterium]|nr:TetR/AcrR family transcriptional regulator [Oscillospiraceae bacterium]